MWPGSRGEGSAGLPQRAHEPDERVDVSAVGTKRIDECGGDDHAICSRFGKRSNVRGPTDPEADRDGEREPPGQESSELPRLSRANRARP